MRHLIGTVFIAVTLLAPAAAPAQTGDTTPPVATITGPADGSVFRTGQHVPYNWECSDPGTDTTGIGECTMNPADGIADTSTTGAKKVTLTAVDRAGNRTVVERTYTVEESGVLGETSSNELRLPTNCFTRTRWKATFKGPDEDPLISISVYFGSKRVARRTGALGSRAAFTFRNLPRRSFVVRAIVRTESGRRIVKKRRAMPC